MKIEEAKRELYTQLRAHDAVTGAGIGEKNGSEFIVIYLTEINKAVMNQIPKDYKGNKVKTEVRSVARAV